MCTNPRRGLPGTQAFILAGGQGERLLPLTASRPKPAIPYGGVFRIVDFTLSNCLSSNLVQVALLTQYRRDELHNCESGMGYDFGHNVIPSLIDSARVFAFDFRDEGIDGPRYWRDIGTIDSYYDGNMDLIRPRPAFNPYSEDGWYSARPLQRQRGANVSGSASIVESVLSPGVRVEADALVSHSVLMPGVRIGRGARIRRAIVAEGVQIPSDFEIGWDRALDRKHYTISPQGVVVVGETPQITKPAVSGWVPDRAVLGFKSGALA